MKKIGMWISGWMSIAFCVIILLSSSLHHSPGEAEAILVKAQATAKGLTLVSQALKDSGGVEVRFLSSCLAFNSLVLWILSLFLNRNRLDQMRSFLKLQWAFMSFECWKLFFFFFFITMVLGWTPINHGKTYQHGIMGNTKGCLLH